MSVKRLAPGLYEDAAGELHFDCAEACVELGWPITPENEDRAEALIRRALDASGHSETEVVVTNEPPPWRGYG